MSRSVNEQKMLDNKLNTKFGDLRMVMVQFVAVAATLIPRLTTKHGEFQLCTLSMEKIRNVC